jgi:hypothetical protein
MNPAMMEDRFVPPHGRWLLPHFAADQELKTP